jgi:hypothetical protein
MSVHHATTQPVQPLTAREHTPAERLAQQHPLTKIVSKEKSR